MQYLSLILAVVLASAVHGFVSPLVPTIAVSQDAHERCYLKQQRIQNVLTLEMAADGKKKKRRRRKTDSGEAVVDARSSVTLSDNDAEEIKDLTDEDKSLIEDVAKFTFKPKSDPVAAISNDPTTAGDLTNSVSAAIPLPDIKEAKRRKEMEAELERMEEEKESNRVRIKRTDKEAFRKLLEQQPFADADESYFEEEAYGTVSALLGEKAKPFLGIPFGPLQIGHFIGSLGIMLTAFVEYPGFPLTNLPTPLRDALQGGLGAVYAINTALAVAAAFKASERGQPKPFWVVKTFFVGGLAYDQLTQLPTLEQVEKAKARKGARALKKKQQQR